MFNTSQQKFDRIIIIGAGMVGATTAYTLVVQQLASEIILVDVNAASATAQALDIEHAASNYKDSIVRFGTYDDILENDLVIMTAGAARQEGQSRLDLLKINAAIAQNVADGITQNVENVNLIVVANPVDVLTHIFATHPKLKGQFIVGSGTLLDSKRLWAELLRKGIPLAEAQKALVIGEHGDSSVSLYSQISPEFRPADNEQQQISTAVKEAGKKIIAGKKATYYGIAAAISTVVTELANPTAQILPLSVIPNGEYGLRNVSLGLPVKYGAQGLEIVSLAISEQEQNQLQNSAKILAESIASLELE
jgi:L-lactate dehydrogenase